MLVVNLFLFFSLHKRIHQQPTFCARYGPLLLTCMASVFIMADPLRHVLQDETLHVADIPAMILLVMLAPVALIKWYTSYTQRNFGVVLGHPRAGRESFKCHFTRVSFFYGCVLAAVLLFVYSHSAAGRGWTGATVLRWQECGDNPMYDRTNSTWTEDCFWSSSQFKCTLPCCVPNPAFPHTAEELKDCTCSCIPTNMEHLNHLSPMGVLFTIGCTYTGFILLAIGTMWNANIGTKLSSIKDKWRQLRRHRE